MHDANTKPVCNNRKMTKTKNDNSFDPRGEGEVVDLRGRTMSGTSSFVPSAPRTTDRQATWTVSATNPLSREARSFALSLSRFPFPPFIMRFTSTLINEQEMAEDLCKSIEERTKADLELSGYRKASARCAPNGCDFLVLAKDGGSFVLLYDDANWPHSLLNLAFTRPSTPSILPQLSLIVKKCRYLTGS